MGASQKYRRKLSIYQYFSASAQSIANFSHLQLLNIQVLNLPFCRNHMEKLINFSICQCAVEKVHLTNQGPILYVFY